MTTISFVDELVNSGMKLWVVGDELKIRAPHGMLTPDVKARLKALKPQLIAELSRRNCVVPPATSAFAEVASAPTTSAGTTPATIQGQLAAWRSKLDGLQEPDCRELQALISSARGFLDNPLAIEAIRYGWNATELFGVNTFAPRVRRDSWGLVATIAWSNPSRELTTLDEKYAAFRVMGGKLMSPRTPIGYRYARPLWGVLKDACGGYGC